MSPEMSTETRTIEREGAARLRATIVLGAGELWIAGGGAGALVGEFSTNVPAWRPEITYTVEGETGRLSVRQPEVEPRPKVQDARQRWSLAFPDGVPLDLQIVVGAATGTLVLGALALERLALDSGAGTLTLDLGAARAPLDVTLKGGVLDGTLALPGDYGALVEVQAPIATVRADHLTAWGNRYANAAYRDGAGAVRVRVAAGVVNLALTVGARSR